jgi:type III pantothenate kinase
LDYCIRRDGRTAFTSSQTTPGAARHPLEKGELKALETLKPFKTWRISTVAAATPDELLLTMRSLIDGDEVEIDAMAISSVVPDVVGSWRKTAQVLTGRAPFMVEVGCRFDCEIEYPHPAEIGADRLADAEAASVLYGAPVIVVDFGTATNIEVVAERTGRAAFLGGVIMPGLETSAAALFSHAAKLPMVDLAPAPQMVGKSSAQAIQSGLIQGEVARIDGVVAKLVAEMGEGGRRPTVVATGGLAERIAPLSQSIEVVNRELTLQGIALLYWANCGHGVGQTAQVA